MLFRTFLILFFKRAITFTKHQLPTLNFQIIQRVFDEQIMHARELRKWWGVGAADGEISWANAAEQNANVGSRQLRKISGGA